MPEFEINGHCDEKFTSVRDAFEKNFNDGLELGASCAVYVEGEMVVDLWGGFSDMARTRPWEKDTIVQVSSSSKIPVALCGLMAIDRGLIDLDAPVATYWPEFAQNGKENLLVRHIFSHSSGLPGIDGLPGFDVLDDWDEVIARLAAQRPWSEPGTKSAYHAMTFGHLIGELVRKTTGKPISQFFRDEVGDPLEIDFHLGLPEAQWSRPAEIEEDFSYPTEAPTEADEAAFKKSTYYRVLGYMSAELEAPMGRKPWRFNMPAGNGVGNARSLAQIGSLLARGGLAGGKRFFNEETGRLPYEEQSYRFDSVMYAPVRWGLGFGLTSKEIPYPWPNTFHWGGAGGSSVVMVPEHGASWAYAPNKFSSGGAGDDPRAERIAAEVVRGLQGIEKQA